MARLNIFVSFEFEKDNNLKNSFYFQARQHPNIASETVLSIRSIQTRLGRKKRGRQSKCVTSCSSWLDKILTMLQESSLRPT